MTRRLHERSVSGRSTGRGLRCDDTGLWFADRVALVVGEVDAGRRVFRVSPVEQIGKALSAGYGVPFDVVRHLPALKRIASLMTEGHRGLAQITALQLGLPDLPDDDAVERLTKVDDLFRFNPNHKPSGPGGGQFTVGSSAAGVQPAGGRAVRGRPEAAAASASQRNNPTSSAKLGVAVILPDGQRMRDPKSPTGFLMSPVADLSPVAASGREVGSSYRAMLSDPQVQTGAIEYLGAAILANVGTGGRFDFQRKGNIITGFKQFRQFRPVANFNVGLFMQQTGLFSLDDTLRTAGTYAHWLSSNARPNAAHGLDPSTEAWISAGYRAGTAGNYGRAAGQ
jgi:hypothetical protein